ncbi:hypothetical protein QQ045_007645 [Rhodiola kirilowii]
MTMVATARTVDRGRPLTGATSRHWGTRTFPDAVVWWSMVMALAGEGRGVHVRLTRCAGGRPVGWAGRGRDMSRWIDAEITILAHFKQRIEKFFRGKVAGDCYSVSVSIYNN